MNATNREKRTILAGGVVAGLILLIAYVVLPLAREWQRLGDSLRPRLRYVEMLQQRARRQNALLARRNALVARVGWVLGQNAPSSRNKAKRPKTKAKGAADPESGISLAAHVERIAKQSSVSIKQITRGKPASRRKADKHFAPVGLQVRLEAHIQSVIKFLHALEKGERLVRAERVECRRDLKRGRTLKVTLHVVGYESVTK